jgi:hypothetical protein
MPEKPNEDLFMEQGDFSYPFNVTLPDNLPISFENSNGRISYSVSSTISTHRYIYRL